MMMAPSRESIRPALAAVLPPELYFRASTRLLQIARHPFMACLLGRSGLILALHWSNGLSRTGMISWRVRRRSSDL